MENTDLSLRVSVVCDDVKKRRRNFHYQSFLSLGLIISTILGCVVFFIYASTILQKDKERTHSVTELQIKSQEEKILTLQQRIDDVNKEISKMQTALSQEKSGLNSAARTLMGLGPQADIIRNNIDAKIEQRDYIKKELDASFELLLSLQKHNNPPPYEKTDDIKGSFLNPEFISTLLTRLVIVTFSSYLAKIFFDQYKYASRMASHCDFVHDLIILKNGVFEKDELLALLSVINPQIIDFKGNSDINFNLISQLISNQNKHNQPH